MKSLLAIVCVACAASARADSPGPSDSTVVRARLEPGKLHEECMRLEAGQKRSYYWKSDAPADFNIHFHRGDEVITPVKRERMRGDGGTFTAKSGEDYCWMWRARDKPAKIEGGIDAK